MLHYTLIPLVLVLSGTFNVLLIKWSNNIEAECNDGNVRHFQHPVFQVGLMFLGEILCFILYKLVYFFLKRRGDYSENENILTRGSREFPMHALYIPALLDAIASILLFTGLYLTYASSFQMLKGAAIIFVGIFSTIFLNQSLTTRHWVAIITIICGVSIIVSTDIYRVAYDTASIRSIDSNAVLTGDLLVLIAQILHALKYVYEERHAKEIPTLQAVGWQGIFGFLITILLAVIMNYTPSIAPLNQNSHGVFDDFGDIFTQIHSNTLLLLPLLSFVIFSACHNFIALHIIKISSTSNLILAEGLCVIFVWVFVLLLNWEYLNILTVIACIILEMGVLDYRRAIFIDLYRTMLARLALRRYEIMHREEDNAAPTTRAADVI